MIDEHLQQVNSYFAQFEILAGSRRKIFRQLQRIPSQSNSSVYDNYIQYASGQKAASLPSNTRQSDLNRRLEIVEAQCSVVAEQIAHFGDFETDKLTKYLAGVLTRKTNTPWLPVRYLLHAGTCRQPRIDAYGLIKAEAVKTLPGIPDTMTLLDRKFGLPQLNSWVKFRETECQKAGCLQPEYSSIQNMDNIWMFTSNDFISVGASEQFNAFFNVNGVENKPFLHLYVGARGENSLREIGKIKGLPCYSNYDDPCLPQSHPRNIALNALSQLVSARIERSKEEDKSQTAADDHSSENNSNSIDTAAPLTASMCR